MDYKNILLSQRTLSEISGISLPTINRFITNNNIEHMKDVGKIKRYSIETCRDILRRMKFGHFKPTKKIQVFYNFKGGTGKTSICFQIASHLSFLGFNVLTIDCDAQGHLSSCFHQLNKNNEGHTIYDALIGSVPISRCIKNVFDGLDIIPANLSLTRAEVGLSHANNREKLLLKQLEQVKGMYDYILIDTNPTISTLNFNTIIAADDVNIICETQPLAYSGLRILIHEIEKFSKEMENLNISMRIIPNKFEQKTSNAQEILGALRANYNNLVTEYLVRKSEDFNECSKSGTPLAIKFYKDNSPALEDIIELLHELITKTCELDSNVKVA